MSHSTTLTETEREQALMEIGDDFEDIRDNLSDEVGMILVKLENMREAIQARDGQDGQDMATLDQVIQACLGDFEAADEAVFEDFGQSWHDVTRLRDRLLALKR